jgi:hypothetical protein
MAITIIIINTAINIIIKANNCIMDTNNFIIIIIIINFKND